KNSQPSCAVKIHNATVMRPMVVEVRHEEKGRGGKRRQHHRAMRCDFAARYERTSSNQQHRARSVEGGIDLRENRIVGHRATLLCTVKTAIWQELVICDL